MRNSGYKLGSVLAASAFCGYKFIVYLWAFETPYMV